MDYEVKSKIIATAYMDGHMAFDVDGVITNPKKDPYCRFKGNEIVSAFTTMTQVLKWCKTLEGTGVDKVITSSTNPYVYGHKTIEIK